MRILQVSDLHLEFDPSFRIYNHVNADMLFLGGDIIVGTYLTKSAQSSLYRTTLDMIDFFRICSEEFPHVVYIFGNHEYYKGAIDTIPDIIRNALNIFPNIYILDNDSININGFNILGGTLWTNCRNRDPIILNYLSGYLNDFRLISNSKQPYSKFLPLDSAIRHSKTLDFFANNITDNTIIMSHHAPSQLSVHENFKTEVYGNQAYYSNLEDFILDNPQIKLWTHGHMHNTFDYVLGDTRIVCNPRGYRGENPNFSTTKVIDV